MNSTPLVARPKGVIFDAYGTLFDVHTVRDACGEITKDPDALSMTWRQKQLEYTWLRALMGRYEDFWKVTGDALRFTVRRLRLEASEEQLDHLLEAYLSLCAYPDVGTALGRLEGLPLAILSNGTPRMLEAALQSSNLSSRFRHVLSVDKARTYKPSPAAYALGPGALGCSAGDLFFVSSNAWDVSGAKAFGYRVCWCNRANAPTEELGIIPDLVVDRLDQIPERLSS